LKRAFVGPADVKKPIPAILMNYDNQTVIAKVNSDKDNAKSTR
jgi:hypothetical protein